MPWARGNIQIVLRRFALYSSILVPPLFQHALLAVIMSSEVFPLSTDLLGASTQATTLVSTLIDPRNACLDFVLV